MSDETRAEIRGIFDRLQQMFRKGDFSAVRELWDPDLEKPVYLAEEAHDFVTDWAGFADYFKRTADTLPETKVGYEIGEIVPLGPGLISVLCTLEWHALMPPATEPIGGLVRLSTVFRKTPVGWRLVSYVEAPLAPIVYMRELYKMVARNSKLP